MAIHSKSKPVSIKTSKKHLESNY